MYHIRQVFIYFLIALAVTMFVVGQGDFSDLPPPPPTPGGFGGSSTSDTTTSSTGSTASTSGSSTGSSSGSSGSSGGSSSSSSGSSSSSTTTSTSDTSDLPPPPPTPGGFGTSDDVQDEPVTQSPGIVNNIDLSGLEYDVDSVKSQIKSVKSSTLVLFILSIINLIAIGGVAAMVLMKPKVKADDSLKTYVQGMFAQGYNKEFVTQQLHDSGYSQEQIEAAL